MNNILEAFPLLSQYSIIVAAVLVAAGGLTGFLKAGSKASLISGVISGTLAALAFVVTFIDMRIGHFLGLAVMMVLQIVFAIRLRKTKKFMPSGVMLLISITVELLLIIGLLKELAII
ncbi:MAG: TMEM14 family protein [Candidatus Obscuribacterales bacterium]|nr:TMEM14 family protein [Candidatus Obscuribacterales bacterium]